MDSSTTDLSGLPEKTITNHPFHPHHTLNLLDCEENLRGVNCSTCRKALRKDYLNPIYKCLKCDYFRMCYNCSTLEPNISYPGHEHKLCFIEKETDQELAQCDADDCYRYQYSDSNSVPEELERAENYMSIFRCVPCDFNIVHLLCGPLPRTIKYQYHIHELRLAHSVKDIGSDEYYCDACESERDPKICVYHCEPCKYVAHVHCLINEITSVLKSKNLNDDELKLGNTENVDIKDAENGQGRKTTLLNILNSLSEDDREIFEQHFELPNRNSKKPADIHGDQYGYGNYKSHRIPREYFFPASDWDFQRLVRSFDKYCNFRRLRLKSTELKVNFKEINNYMVAWDLVADLKKLLEDHPDIVARCSKLAPGMKSLAFHFLCKVLHSRNGLMEIEPSTGLPFCRVCEERLREWYGCLKFVSRMGFRVDFVYEQLEIDKRDFFLRHANSLEGNILEKLTEEKLELQRKIDKVEEELQKCREFKTLHLQWRLSKRSWFDLI